MTDTLITHTSTGITPQMFAEKTTDLLYQGTWSRGVMDIVVEALAGQPVAIILKKSTGFALVGVTLAATIETWSGGVGLPITSSASGIVNYRLPDVGAIIPLAESISGTPARFVASGLLSDRTREAIAKVRPAAEETGHTYGKWEAVPIAGRRWHVRYTPQREGAGKFNYWPVEL